MPLAHFFLPTMSNVIANFFRYNLSCLGKLPIPYPWNWFFKAFYVAYQHKATKPEKNVSPSFHLPISHSFSCCHYSFQSKRRNGNLYAYWKVWWWGRLLRMGRRMFFIFQWGSWIISMLIHQISLEITLLISSPLFFWGKVKRIENNWETSLFLMDGSWKCI